MKTPATVAIAAIAVALAAWTYVGAVEESKVSGHGATGSSVRTTGAADIRLATEPAAPPAATTADDAAAQRKAKEEAARQAAEYTRTRHTLMTGKSLLQFENASVKDALKSLAEVGNFTIVFDPALEEGGLDLSTRTVSLRASGMILEDALFLILPRECGYQIGPGYVRVTTLEKSWLPLKVGTYGIQLALAEVPDFTDAPHFDLGDVLKQAASSGGGGGIFQTKTQTDTSGAATPDRIIEMVKKFVKNSNDRRIAPWDDEGGPATIQYLGGRLIISQTDHGHRAVAKLLAAIE